MRRYLIIVVAWLFVQVIAASAVACVPAPWRLVWPHDGQQAVPTNAGVMMYCWACDPLTVLLRKQGGSSEIELEKTWLYSETDESSVSSDYALYLPPANLEPSTTYEVILRHASYGEMNYIWSFTTGADPDVEPPLFGDDPVQVKIEWFDDGEVMEVENLTSCGSGIVPAEELSATEAERALPLPAHYRVMMMLKANQLDDVCEAGIFSIEQLDEDGGTLKAQNFYGTSSFPLGRLYARDVGSSQTFRIVAEDILGNIQPEPIDVVVSFAQDASTFIVKGFGTETEARGISLGDQSSGCTLIGNGKQGGYSLSLIVMNIAVAVFFIVRTLVVRLRNAASRSRREEGVMGKGAL